MVMVLIILSLIIFKTAKENFLWAKPSCYKYRRFEKVKCWSRQLVAPMDAFKLAVSKCPPSNDEMKRQLIAAFRNVQFNKFFGTDHHTGINNLLQMEEINMSMIYRLHVLNVIPPLVLLFLYCCLSTRTANPI